LFAYFLSRLVDFFFITGGKRYFCNMRFFSQNRKFEFLGHIAIWVGYSFLVFSGPLFSEDFSTMALRMTIRTLVINSILFYLNTFVLLPNLVGKSKYVVYIFTIIAIIVSTSVLLQVTDRWFKPGEERHMLEAPLGAPGPHDPFISNTRPDEQGPVIGQDLMDNRAPDAPMQNPDEDPAAMRKFERDNKGRFFKGPGFFFGIMSSLGILFISTIFWIISEAEKRRQIELRLVNENLVTEMKFLKSQINPHFLFNALNNVYALTLTNSKKGPEMLLKLSDMLRFVLYESEDRKVIIGKEVDYIKHFIDFQKIKIEGEPRIYLDIDQADRTILIEPMLLIPFIENAFKHSRLEDTRNNWLRIELHTHQHTIHFKVANSLPATAMSLDKVGGIGIENVKKRLNFLYPGKHTMVIERTDKEFKVEMTIITQ
jgi:hypothetical protein